jgi:hypothetical protein
MAKDSEKKPDGSVPSNGSQPDSSKLIPREKLPKNLQKLVDQDDKDSVWDQLYDGRQDKLLKLQTPKLITSIF